MSAFDQDITEEERNAGFDPGAQGDETFSLEKIEEYPGVLPEFEWDEEPLIPSPEGNESEQAIDEPIDDSQELDQEENDDDPDSFSDENLDDEIEVVDDLSDIEVAEEDAEIADNLEVNNTEDLSEGIKDEGLIELLESELERSKQRKEGGEPETQNESQPQFDPETGQRIYSDDEIELVEEGMPEFSDFNEKEAFGKVLGGEEDSQSESENREFPDLNESEDNNETEEDSETKPKVKRKIRLSTIIIISVFSIAIIGIIGLAISYWNLLKDALFSPEPKVKEIVVEKPKTIKEFKLRLLDNPDEKLEFSDSSEFVLNIPEPITPDSNQVIYEVIDDMAELEVPDPKKIETTSDVKFVRKSKEKTEPKTFKSSNKDVSYKKPKSVKKPLASEKRKVIRKDPNRKQRSRKGLFSVQIHVTASKDDAKEWISKLAEKGLKGFITEKVVRDQVWYRVRFGEFKTYEDAYTAAINAGFDGTWIDRLD